MPQPDVNTLKKLLSSVNKNFKIRGIWKMKRAQLLQKIRSEGYKVEDHPTWAELRPLGGKTHVRKRIVIVEKKI